VCAPSPGQAAAGIALTRAEAEIIEVAALRNGAAAMRRYGAACGEPLPGFGRVHVGDAQLALCVRPARWLFVAALSGQIPAARAARWRHECAGQAAVTELSCALAAFILAGSAVREVLARGCRLDLDLQVFPAGHAAATVMAQVAVTLAALPHGMLLLTPASTAQHFAEWLESAARPFGRAAEVHIQQLFDGKTAAR
jgi:heterotetrameric sarcosine oxidase gamma subunit